MSKVQSQLIDEEPEKHSLSKMISTFNEEKDDKVSNTSQKSGVKSKSRSNVVSRNVVSKHIAKEH